MMAAMQVGSPALLEAILKFNHGSGPAQPGLRNCVYNLFKNKQRSEILCAVPEDHPIPGFLGPEQWTFDRPLRPLDMLPPGFHERAAQTGVRFNGFYLFQVTDTHGKIAA